MTDLIAFTATRYRCPHCRRSYAQEASARRHLGRCFKSPAIRSCKTCQYFSDTDYSYGPVCIQGLVDPQSCYCSTCGEGPLSDLCSEMHDARPVTGMRVRCDEWVEDQ